MLNFKKQDNVLRFFASIIYRVNIIVLFNNQKKINMKRLIKNPFAQMAKVIVATLCFLMLAGSFTSCSKRGESSDIYYVVGYDGTSEVDIENGTAKSGGYLFISEENIGLLLENNLIDNMFSGNLDDIILVNNLIADDFGNRIADPFEGVIDFPKESMPESALYCWYRFFPEEYRFAFKVQMTFRPMTEEEKRYVPRLINGFCDIMLGKYIKNYHCIVISSIEKIQ